MILREQLRISLIHLGVSPIIFRHLPGVAAIEHQLEMQFRERLLDDEVEELPHLIDELSLQLFRITRQQTFYWALPNPVQARFDRSQWESNFDPLWQHQRDPNAYLGGFNLDVRCEKGQALHCLEPFGRQLICALNRLHPSAVIAFADPDLLRAA